MIDKFERMTVEKINGLAGESKMILIDAGRLADEMNCRAYVVGGFVRDLILGCENNDIDIVVEADGIEFARKLAEIYDAPIEEHQRFKTALVNLKGSFSIDLVTARKEWYKHPAALPEVEPGTIRDDLYRRDFTINSMAVSLNKGSFGELVDFYGGFADLERGLVRILHNKSFIDDPTRLFRAVRFEQRYGFRLDEDTEKLALAAVSEGYLCGVSKERISSELFLILQEKSVSKVLARADEMGLLKAVYPEINMDGSILNHLEQYGRKAQEFIYRFGVDQQLDMDLVHIIILHSNMSYAQAEVSCERMKLTRLYREEVLEFISARDKVGQIADKSMESDGFEIYTIFKDVNLETMFALTLTVDRPEIFQMVEEYIKKMSKVRLTVTGNDLKAMGLTPGPQYKEIMEKALRAKLIGEIRTHEEEIKYIIQLRKAGEADID